MGFLNFLSTRISSRKRYSAKQAIPSWLRLQTISEHVMLNAQIIPSSKSMILKTVHNIKLKPADALESVHNQCKHYQISLPYLPTQACPPLPLPDLQSDLDHWSSWPLHLRPHSPRPVLGTANKGDIKTVFHKTEVKDILK